jgi:tRNA(Ile)-lysidine synthase TilS/MesJ
LYRSRLRSFHLNRSMIHEGDIERGSGKPPFFDGINYLYWKIRMLAHLQGIDWKVWEICENANYIVLDARNTLDQIDQHNINSMACSVLFSSLLLSKFERVSDCTTTREIWVRLQNYHKGTAQVKTRLFEMYKQESPSIPCSLTFRWLWTRYEQTSRSYLMMIIRGHSSNYMP